jgi:hypothetical protein
MSDEVMMAKMAASMGISVTQLRMRLAVTDTNGRDIMQDIVADNRGRDIHTPSSAIPVDRSKLKGEVPMEPGTGVAARRARW